MNQRDSASYLEKNFPSEIANNHQATFWQTRALMLSAVDAAQANVRLIAQADGAWGDYALYDCAGCHHELRLPSVWQNRMDGIRPGRPRFREWMNPAVRAALRLSAREETVDQLRRKLLASVSKQPFGNPDDCIPIARDWLAEMNDVLGELSAVEFGASRAMEFLEALASTPQAMLLDYQAAQHVVWSIRTVRDELARSGWKPSQPLQDAIDELGTKAGTVVITRALPTRKDQLIFGMTDADNSNRSLLSRELARMQKYDVDAFVAQLEEIRNQLGAGR